MSKKQPAILKQHLQHLVITRKKTSAVKHMTAGNCRSGWLKKNSWNACTWQQPWYISPY